jgi:hypothetical protein
VNRLRFVTKEMVEKIKEVATNENGFKVEFK